MQSPDTDSSLAADGHSTQSFGALCLVRVRIGGGGEKDGVLELAKLRLVRYRCGGRRAAVVGERKRGRLVAL